MKQKLISHIVRTRVGTDIDSVHLTLDEDDDIETAHDHNSIEYGSLESLEDQLTTVRRTMMQSWSRNFPVEESGDAFFN